MNRFYAINATGTTVHVRLDRDDADELRLTVTKRKVEVNRRPISTYVLASKTPTHIAYLDNLKVFTLMNPEKLKFELFIDSDKDQILKVIGFMN